MNADITVNWLALFQNIQINEYQLIKELASSLTGDRGIILNKIDR